MQKRIKDVNCVHLNGLKLFSLVKISSWIFSIIDFTEKKLVIKGCQKNLIGAIFFILKLILEIF